LGASWRKEKNVQEYCECYKTAVIIRSGKDKVCPACGFPRLWWFAIVKGKDKFIAMQKNEPFESDNPDPIREHGIVYFEMGETQEKAFAKLLRAQQSMHLTSGSLRGLWASFWLRVSSALKHFTSPPTGR